MFQQVDADVYVIVDGDDTYPASEVHKLIAPVLEGKAEMVVGSRLMPSSESDFRLLNKVGNGFFLTLINAIFKVKLSDVLSGYRAFSREFVKSIPVFGGGFETEVELTVKALARGYRITEIPVRLTARPQGSFSKIRIVQDGFVILNTILSLVRDYKPLTFFGGMGLVLIILWLRPRNRRDRGIHQDRPGAAPSVGGISGGIGLVRNAVDCSRPDPAYNHAPLPGTRASIALARISECGAGTPARCFLAAKNESTKHIGHEGKSASR